ncbi:MAG TPA: hypothetical protein PK069_03225 [Methanolinea sp.]|nr:hypothetical protein [Methanolinea sp.]HQK55369.1 hypothetical protein [Methanolinea sp.]
MAAASLIATALGIVLILLTAYFLAGGALSAIGVVSDAQRDTTIIRSKMLGTSVSVLGSSAGDSLLYVEILNDGREPIREMEGIDVYLNDPAIGWSIFTYSQAPGTGHWSLVRITAGDYSAEKIYTNQWDPGEILNMSISYSGINPNYFKIVTANGVGALFPV